MVFPKYYFIALGHMVSYREKVSKNMLKKRNSNTLFKLNCPRKRVQVFSEEKRGSGLRYEEGCKKSQTDVFNGFPLFYQLFFRIWWKRDKKVLKKRTECVLTGIPDFSGK